jgi:hypothetical protein
MEWVSLTLWTFGSERLWRLRLTGRPAIRPANSEVSALTSENHINLLRRPLTQNFGHSQEIVTIDPIEPPATLLALAF